MLWKNKYFSIRPLKLLPESIQLSLMTIRLKNSSRSDRDRPVDQEPARSATIKKRFQKLTQAWSICTSPQKLWLRIKIKNFKLLLKLRRRKSHHKKSFNKTLQNYPASCRNKLDGLLIAIKWLKTTYSFLSKTSHNVTSSMLLLTCHLWDKKIGSLHQNTHKQYMSICSRKKSGLETTQFLTK